MSDIRHIKPSGSVPKRISKVMNGTLVERKKICRCINGKLVVVWDVGGGDMVFVFNIPSANYIFKFDSLYPNSTHTYDIDWGDGSVEVGLSASSLHRHTYDSAGLKTITINNYTADYMSGSFLPTDKTLLISAELPKINSFTTDGYGATFSGCTNLEKLTFGNITTVPVKFCYDCKKLKEVDISNVDTIYGSAFENCGITTAKLKENINVFQSAFKNSGLTSIHIPTGTYGEAVFMNCKNLKSYTWGENTVILAHMFQGSAVSFYVAPSVVTIGIMAFAQCTNLGTSITIPANVSTIAQYAFSATGITDIYIQRNRSDGYISGQPWGATGATVHYLDD